MYISNNQYQKNTNISSIFEMVWRNTNISRIEIAKKLDLYRSTITNIISSLIEKDLILEGVVGSSSAKGGRPPISLTINKNFGCIIGIDLQPENYTVVVISVDGSILLSTTAVTPFNDEFRGKSEACFIYAMDKIIESILAPVSELHIPVLGICVCVSGIVDVDKGLIKYSDPFGLIDFPFAETFYSRYGVPCTIENDARCLAWKQFAMQRGDKVEKEDFICVLAKNMEGRKAFDGARRSGIGVGLSIAIKGSLLHGNSYSVGEYVSATWTGDKPSQSGLDENIIKTLFKSEDSYKMWVADLFKTLTIYIPLLAPEKIFIYGQAEEKEPVIKKVIEDDVPQFLRALKRYDCSLVFKPSSPHELAEGAAYKYLQQMFVVMQTDNDSWIKSYDWDAAFKLRERGLKTLQLHV
ncbi:MAG: ROK family transcriptional regulator [Treponema sp.]|nr:ROK family transcriptional regulator [Treponema sp.]